MARDNPSGEDPIIAALPPETDYITYLTILEYNLTPEKLPVINQLLESDDGSLAENIGWDLLGIVLPMLDYAPEDATKCLEIVSTRANPREVVIQVAGELAKLGIDKDEQDEDEVVDGDEDDLTTFEGEAERIHLGRLDFKGLPLSQPEDSDNLLGTSTEPGHETVKAGLNESKFLALTLMLSILHPRIRTLHPSRFLATSLTAALRAYRNIPTTSTLTKAFVILLQILQRAQKATSAPPLPPRRNSDPGRLSRNAVQREDIETSHDSAIVKRLLQAVTLEVLEHYVLSFRAHHISSMAWTMRLRERLERRRAPPGRRLEIERCSSTPELETRDEILSKFVSLAQDLDLESELHTFAGDLDPLGHSSRPPSSPTGVESDSDYPASPDQIPLSVPAMVYLHAFAEFRRSLNSEKTGLLMTLTGVARVSLYLLNMESRTQHEQYSDNQPRSLPTPAVDAILTLLYLQTTKQTITALRRRDIFVMTSTTQRCLFDLLVEIFISSPDSDVRESAHYIASILLHDDVSSDERYFTMRKVLRMTVYQDHSDGTLLEAARSVPDMMSANLRSVAVNWLKEEIVYHTLNHTRVATSESDTSNPIAERLGMPPIFAISVENSELAPLLYPTIPAPPNVSSTSSTTEKALILDPKEDQGERHINDFLSNLSFYISTLNLLYICMTKVYLEYKDCRTGLRETVIERLKSFAPWRTTLLEFMHQAQQKRGNVRDCDDHEATGDNQQVLESMSEIWAFEDAMDRLERVLEKRQKERLEETME